MAAKLARTDGHPTASTIQTVTPRPASKSPRRASRLTGLASCAWRAPQEPWAPSRTVWIPVPAPASVGPVRNEDVELAGVGRPAGGREDQPAAVAGKHGEAGEGFRKGHPLQAGAVGAHQIEGEGPAARIVQVGGEDDAPVVRVQEGGEACH